MHRRSVHPRAPPLPARTQVYVLWSWGMPMNSMAASSYGNGSGNAAEVFCCCIEQLHALMLLPSYAVVGMMAIHVRTLYVALALANLSPSLFWSVVWTASHLAAPHLLLRYMVRASQCWRGGQSRRGKGPSVASRGAAASCSCAPASTVRPHPAPLLLHPLAVQTRSLSFRDLTPLGMSRRSSQATATGRSKQASLGLSSPPAGAASSACKSGAGGSAGLAEQQLEAARAQKQAQAEEDLALVHEALQRQHPPSPALAAAPALPPAQEAIEGRRQSGSPVPVPAPAAEAAPPLPLAPALAAAADLAVPVPLQARSPSGSSSTGRGNTLGRASRQALEWVRADGAAEPLPQQFMHLMPPPQRASGDTVSSQVGCTAACTRAAACAAACTWCSRMRCYRLPR